MTFNIPTDEYVILEIFNLTGQEITKIINGGYSSGKYEVEWNAKAVPGGIYFARLKAGKFVQTYKLLLLK